MAILLNLVKSLFQVKTTNEMWSYIKLTFVPALHIGDGPYISDDTNILVGVARIRQLRIVASMCYDIRSLIHHILVPAKFHTFIAPLASL